MRTLGSVGVRSFRRARGRWLLTATGVTLGVAVLFAVEVANTSASSTVERRFGAAETAVVQLASADQQLPASVPEAAAELDGVHLVNTYAGLDVRLVGRERDGQPWTTWLGASTFARGPDFDPDANDGPRFSWDGKAEATKDDEIVIGAATAAELDLAVGDAFEIDSPTGTHELHVVGIGRRKDGERTAFGLATTPSTVERVGGKRANQLAFIHLADGVDADDWLDAHRFELPPTVIATATGFDQESFREFVRGMNDGFAVGALTAVFIGAFLIFLTMSMQVTERTATFGMFRALGATRAQVARVVFAEALTLAVVATVAGLALGAVIAIGLTRLVSDLYDVESTRMTITAGSVVLAVITGIAVTLLGAAVPAWRAARLDPVSAMRRDLPEPKTRLRLAYLGVVIAAFALVIGVVRPPTRNDPTLLVVLAGVVLALPLAVGPLASAVGRVTSRLAPGIGRVGVLHLEKERSRSAYTMGLVMVVLATVFALGSVRTTFEREVDHIVAKTMAGDLLVDAGAGFEGAELDALRDREEVAALTAGRWIPTRIELPDHVRRAAVIAVDPGSYFDVGGLPLVDGDESDVRTAFLSGRPVAAVTEHDARALGLSVGDVFPLEAPQRSMDVTVVGIVANLDAGAHPIVVANQLADRLYGEGRPTWLHIAASDGTTPDALESVVRDALKDRSDLYIRHGGEARGDAQRFNREFFSIFQAVVLVALVVGLLGLANTLAFSILRRTREVGVLRATGTQRREIVAMITVESLTLAGAAAVLAIPLGAVISALVVKSVSGGLAATVPLQLSWSMVPVVVITAVLLAVAAALLPARRAARLDPVDSLRFD